MIWKNTTWLASCDLKRHLKPLSPEPFVSLVARCRTKGQLRCVHSEAGPGYRGLHASPISVDS